ncbi:MAG: hypothetical protein GY778_15990 [bacterium]|nr:hypothetical protein [bacterium]
MVKTLVCLVVCMTTGATLLTWLEPTPGDYANGRVALGTQTDPALLRGLARRVVQTADARPHHRWQAIAVVGPARTTSPATGTLTATRPRDDLHFLISRQGRFQSLPAWQRQRSLGNDTGVILVGLAASDSEQRIPSAQWEALRALLEELRHHTDSLPKPLPVALAAGPDEDSSPASPAVRHLRILMTDEGLIRG